MYDFIVVGDWHLSFVTGVSLSSCDYKVAMATSCESIKKLDLSEPGLNEAQEKAEKDGNLTFLDKSAQKISAKYIWICEDTDLTEDGRPILEPIKNLIRSFLEKEFEFDAYIVSSQVPLGFCGSLEKEIRKPFIYVPENLRLGKGMETFLQADRFVIGSNNSKHANELKTIIEKNIKAEYIICNLETSEMIKHATNSFLALTISFINQIAQIAKGQNVEMNLVTKGLKADSRIGKKAYLKAGRGFSGGTLMRDVATLKDMGTNLEQPNHLLGAIEEVNKYYIDNIKNDVHWTMNNNMAKKVVLVGYSYKKEVSTLRKSPVVDMAKALKGFDLYGFDPNFEEHQTEELTPYLKHCRQMDELPEDISMIVVNTLSPDLEEIDFKDYPKASDCFFYDIDGAYEKEAIESKGLNYVAMYDY